MAIKAACPICTAAYNLAERQRGKKIRCKHCQGVFVVEEQAGLSAPETPASRAENGIAASPSGSVGRQVDNVRDDRPAPSRRDDYDDKADDRPRRLDDFRPRSREDERFDRRPAGGSKKGLIWLAIIGFVVLAGGGITAVILITNKKDDDKIDSVASAVKGLKSDNIERRREAAKWLNDNPADGKEWGLVNKPLFQATFDQDAETRLSAGFAYAKWIQAGVQAEIKQNFNNAGLGDPFGGDPFRDRVNRDRPRPGVPQPPPQEDITAVAVDKLLGWAGDNSSPNKQRAITELGRRREASGARVIAPYLVQFSEREAAFNALREIGVAAEKEVLPYLHHPDNDARNKTRELLRLYGTDPAKLIVQTIDDLNNADTNRRRAALEWVEQQKPQAGARQADLAQTLEKLLSDSDSGFKHQAIKALARYATQENVLAIASALDADHDKGGHDDFFRAGMALLGQLKDPRGVAAVARFLNHHFVHEASEKSLAAMGAVAQDEVLKFVNHPDDRTRARARKLVQGYKTKDDLLIDQAILDLRDTEQRRRSAAAQWLTDAKPNEAKRDAVARALNEGLKSTDNGAQEAALKALKTWATAENVPALVLLVESTDFNPGRCKQAILILGALKDERGIIPVVGKIRDFHVRKDAVAAAKAMGAVAEPIVLNLLINDGDAGTQTECCNVLKEIGTKQSTQLLGQLRQHRNLQVRTAAAEALQAIQARK